jgi:hypothetical protein
MGIQEAQLRAVAVKHTAWAGGSPLGARDRHAPAVDPPASRKIPPGHIFHVWGCCLEGSFGTLEVEAGCCSIDLVGGKNTQILTVLLEQEYA